MTMSQQLHAQIQHLKDERERQHEAAVEKRHHAKAQTAMQDLKHKMSALKAHDAEKLDALKKKLLVGARICHGVVSYICVSNMHECACISLPTQGLGVASQ